MIRADVGPPQPRSPVHGQRTIREPVALTGIGLHSAKAAKVRCVPAPPESGITFVRCDLPGLPQVSARIASVADVQRGVTLRGDASIRTVEHLLAAVAGLALTNLTVEVWGEELPALDGSAAPYCAALQQAGVDEQDALWHPHRLNDAIWVEANPAWVFGLPAAHLRITCIVPLRKTALGTQVVDFDPERQSFVTEVAPARTWGWLDELDALHARGLALGASSANALGLGPHGYLSRPRFPDEPARHKVVDLLGDLALLGRPLCAHVIAFGAGHALHIEFARRILAGA